ncbi:isocitrate lyase/phosphoenolpyruvate mutase family protein [Bradyrhizobium prioriisuperbiae]|uniref:isocitrate lyase/PEP mutase family protein n=1 Tax=Bradyrhizobium prioriisuperbiae TaxID=2854389 RepID=UPI0028EABB49|nr:isocitrate lyase/phosphoenolpyruvate mutase family protein [Bradyrhizobium prioritasuperba]
MQASYARDFLKLHAKGEPGFVMPNAWDAGSAVVLQSVGFKAIATTSAGIAFSLGRQDYHVADRRLSVSRDEMFNCMRAIASAVDLPVNGDLEAGYGDRPEDVAQTIEDAIAAGLAGGNIEDKRPLSNELYDETLAVERIVAARERIVALKSSFVLTGRTDAFAVLREGAAGVAIKRANLFLEAGADCTYTPGPGDLAVHAMLVKEIAGPLNVVMGLGNIAGNAHALIDAGVKRVSLGGSIARSALGFLRDSACEIRDRGTMSFLGRSIAHGELNALFARG